MSNNSVSTSDYHKYIRNVIGGKGLEIDDKMPIEAFQEAVCVYGSIAADGLWALGDLFVFGERVYGEEYAQAIEAIKYSEKTVKDASWVASEFPPSRRHNALTFNHHKIVAGLQLNDREALLDQAEKEELSTRELTDLKKKKFPKVAKEGSKPKKDKPRSDERLTDAEALNRADDALAFLAHSEKEAHIKTWPKDKIERWEPRLKAFAALEHRLRRKSV